MQRNAMRGAEQDDAADGRRAPEQRIAMGRHRATVFVAGMRRDQQLGWRARSAVAGSDASQVGRNLPAQRLRPGGVEQAVDSGTAHGRHKARLPPSI